MYRFTNPVNHTMELGRGLRVLRKRRLKLAITHIFGMQLWACAERAWPWGVVEHRHV
jgi:hypothetical protein